SAGAWPRCASAMPPRRASRRPARRSRARRASSGTRVRWRRASARIRRTAMASTQTTRTATIERHTGETDVSLSLALSGTGAGTRSSGVGFLDHMLDLLARHARIDLDVSASGDLQTGAHHTAEDTAIVLGQALDAALGDRGGIMRYGSATVPMDEARASCAMDVSGRPFTSFEGRLPPGATGGFEHELTEEFFRAL